MRSLARAFAIRIQNISTNVGLYCMCEQQKLKRVCGLATDTKSTSFFSAKAQTSADLRRLDREPYSYSVHLIDLDTQLTLVFIAYASSGSADECVHMCSLARAISTCV